MKEFEKDSKDNKQFTQEYYFPINNDSYGTDKFNYVVKRGGSLVWSQRFKHLPRDLFKYPVVMKYKLSDMKIEP